MKLNHRDRRARRRWGMRLPLAAGAALAVVWGLVSDTGALAERRAAIEQPTLEDLLRRREASGPSEPERPASVDSLRERQRELRQRRRRIEEGLGPIGQQRSRRPALRVPPPAVSARQVRAVDLDRANPDGVRREARP